MTKKQRVLERRTHTEAIQIRTNADGTIGVRGYAAVFDVEAHGEVIRASAFNRTIAQRDDIRLLVNHDGVPLARTKSGTLTVGVDERGLWFDAPSLDPANPRVQELVSAMSRGDIDQCSFAGYFRDAPVVKGLREVREVEATDVSVVTYPWYDATTATLVGRSRRQLASDIADEMREAVEAYYGVNGGMAPWFWIEDFDLDESFVIWCTYDDDCDYWQCSFVRNADGSIALSGEPVMVVQTWMPAPQEEIDEETGENGGQEAQPKSVSPAEARALLGLSAA